MAFHGNSGRFVIEYHDALHTHQSRNYPMEHLPFGFQSVEIFAGVPEQRAPTFRYSMRSRSLKHGS